MPEKEFAAKLIILFTEPRRTQPTEIAETQTRKVNVKIRRTRYFVTEFRQKELFIKPEVFTILSS